MAGPTDELIHRLLAAADDVAAERIGPLLAEGRDEVEEEIRGVLRSALKAALLRRAVAGLEGLGLSLPDGGGGPPALAPTARDAAPANGGRPGGSPVEACD